MVSSFRNIQGVSHFASLVRCDGVKYHEPMALKTLYNRIARDSRRKLTGGCAILLFFVQKWGPSTNL